MAGSRPGFLAAGLTLLLPLCIGPCPAYSQPAPLADDRPGVVAQTASFGPIVPGRMGTPSTVRLDFHLPIQPRGAAGYAVQAMSTFAFMPSIRSDGGTSITAADIGVGIAVLTSDATLSGSVAVAPEFDRDPALTRVPGARGVAGVQSPRGTLADLLTGREVVRVSKSSGARATGVDDLVVTATVAVPTAFFTPGSFTGTVTLTVVP